MKKRFVRHRKIRAENRSHRLQKTFFYPDYTVGTGFSPVPAFGYPRKGDDKPRARGLIRRRCITTDRELAMADLTLP